LLGKWRFTKTGAAPFSTKQPLRGMVFRGETVGCAKSTIWRGRKRHRKWFLDHPHQSIVVETEDLEVNCTLMRQFGRGKTTKLGQLSRGEVTDEDRLAPEPQMSRQCAANNAKANNPPLF